MSAVMALVERLDDQNQLLMELVAINHDVLSELVASAEEDEESRTSYLDGSPL